MNYPTQLWAIMSSTIPDYRKRRRRFNEIQRRLPS